MIGYLTGTVHEIRVNEVILLVGGVGYRVVVPTYTAVLVGQPLSVWIHHVIREDASDLYGFEAPDDLLLFGLLLKVPGIGPKGALQIFSSCPRDTLVSAIYNKQVEVLSKVPGIGAKTAEKICIELSQKLPEQFRTSPAKTVHRDAIDALVQLGYRERDVTNFIQESDSVFETIEQVVTEFLRSHKNS
jgi:Holliday junction DNA helicase RuvA